MNERAALLASIHESPNDDTARLVFADWLQESGDETRAEFIRAQVTLARMTENDPAFAGLCRQQHELLAAHNEAWVGDRETAAPAHAWSFRRGFPEELDLRCQGIGDEGVAALARSGHLAGLRSPHLEGNALEAMGAFVFRHH